jgi:hypothetical protein
MAERFISNSPNVIRHDLATAEANFELSRLRRCAMLASVLRYDDLLYAVNYLNSKNTNESPVYVIKGFETPLFRTYTSEFDYYFGLGESS